MTLPNYAMYLQVSMTLVRPSGISARLIFTFYINPGYYRPFYVGVMTDADEGPIGGLIDKQNLFPEMFLQSSELFLQKT